MAEAKKPAAAASKKTNALPKPGAATLNAGKAAKKPSVAIPAATGKAVPKAAAGGKPPAAAATAKTPQKAVGGMQEIKLTVVPKGTYPAKREPRDATKELHDRALVTMIGVVKKAGRPVAISEFDLDSRVARPAAKAGFREAKIRLYKGEDHKLYIDDVCRPVAKTVNAPSVPRFRKKASAADDGADALD